MDCLFCNIASRKAPAYIVYEDEDTLGFLDVGARAPGHTVIIPKVHVENILDLDAKLAGPLFGAVKDMTARLKKSLSPDGFTIGINHGKTAGQVIEHLHIHIIPRWQNDGGSAVQSLVENPPKEDLESIKEKILKAS
ncbi:MAG: HIT family protein [Minisyncoccia bacterium]|jgi:histidine triad (HIT) family protein